MNLPDTQHASAPGPVFLIGMPRSGTKLLRDLLNRHPGIRIPETETAILPMLVRDWESYGDLSVDRNFNSFFEKVSRHFFFEYLHQLGRPMTTTKWREYIREYSPAGVFEALIRADTGNDHGSDIIWGDKSPSYINHVELINRLYPEARVVHIIRDVRDYCLSISRAWGKNMYRAAYRWGQGVQSAQEQGQKLGGRYLAVHYEELIESPEETLRSICDLLDIEFVQAMTTLEKPSENFGETRGQATIVASNKQKYLDRLKPNELRRIEELAYPGMLLAGYEPAIADGFKKPSRATLLLQKLQDGYNLSLAVRREHGFIRGMFMHLMHSKTG